MCWSWEVSLGFSIFMLIESIYLIYRNQYIDRYWVLLLSPILIQEICQFIVWKWGIDDETTIHSCNDVNHIVSRIIVSVTLALPPLYCFMVVETIYSKINKCIQIFWKCLFFVETCLYLFLVIFELIDDKFCIFVGNYGHLDWFETIQSSLPDWITWPVYIVIVLFFYMTPLILGTFLYQPEWIMFLPMLYISTIFAVLWAIFSSESYSIWCWSGFVLYIWAILYVPIGKYLLSKYKEKEVKESRNIFIKFFLSGAHQHSVMYKFKYDGIQMYENRYSDSSVRGDEMGSLNVNV